MDNRYAIDMTKGPFLKKLLVFSLPLMLTGLLQMIYNAADTIVVGRFAGSASLAAVGATGSLVCLVLNSFIGLSVGSGVCAARYIGAGAKQSVSNCTHCSMAIALLCGIVVGFFGYFTANQLLVLMDSPNDVIELSTLYVKIIFLGSPASLVYNFGASIIRATGDTKRPLYILVFSGIINIALNLILVIFFHLDVAGVGIATIVSQFISAVLVVAILMKMKDECRLFIRKIRFYSHELKDILIIGIPAGIQNALFSVANVIIQTTVNSFGSAAMAGIAAGSNYDSFIYTCTNAVSQTTMTFCSQNMGAKKYDNLQRIYFRCIAITLIVAGIMSSIGFIFSSQVVGIFSTDPKVIAIGAERNRLIMPFYFFCCLMDLGAGQLRGMGKSIEPMIITLLGGCGLRLLWIYTVFPLDKTLTNLYWAYPVSWAITFLVHFMFYFIEKKKIYKKQRKDKNQNLQTV